MSFSTMLRKADRWLWSELVQSPKNRFWRRGITFDQKWKMTKNFYLGILNNWLAKVSKVSPHVGTPVFDVVFDEPPKTRKTIVVPLVRRQTRWLVGEYFGSRRCLALVGRLSRRRERRGVLSHKMFEEGKRNSRECAHFFASKHKKFGRYLVQQPLLCAK